VLRLNIKSGGESVGVTSKAGLTGAYGGGCASMLPNSSDHKLTRPTSVPFMITQQMQRIALI